MIVDVFKFYSFQPDVDFDLQLNNGLTGVRVYGSGEDGSLDRDLLNFRAGLFLFAPYHFTLV
jgi:hypothetical protein